MSSSNAHPQDLKVRFLLALDEAVLKGFYRWPHSWIRDHYCVCSMFAPSNWAIHTTSHGPRRSYRWGRCWEFVGNLQWVIQLANCAILEWYIYLFGQLVNLIAAGKPMADVESPKFLIQEYRRTYLETELSARKVLRNLQWVIWLDTCVILECHIYLFDHGWCEAQIPHPGIYMHLSKQGYPPHMEGSLTRHAWTLSAPPVLAFRTVPTVKATVTKGPSGSPPWSFLPSEPVRTYLVPACDFITTYDVIASASSTVIMSTKIQLPALRPTSTWGRSDEEYHSLYHQVGRARE